MNTQKLNQEQAKQYSFTEDALTGGNNQNRYLLYRLRISMKNAHRIDIIVSFLMESGVKEILDDLDEAVSRGVQIRILTGNYLGITQPSALYLIKDKLKNKVDLRFFSSQEKDISFHPKAYMFHRNEFSEIYIGSSNISKSALTSGIEWNYRFDNLKDPDNYGLFYKTFEDLFQNHSIVISDNVLKQYAAEWKKPSVQKDLERYDNYDEESKIEELFQPRGAQIEALYALKNSREEGAERGLIYAATGIGKTYLAAFDSVGYEKVLFVAHRDEILKQAADSFQSVRKSEDYGFFTGKDKTRGKSVIFASVASLGKENYLKEDYFSRDYFDYIVIDEFHHAVANQYKRIIEYFKPKFLLGLTATPERMDGRNIYELCDYNVPYQISLKAAINKGLLVPFHYYGIYDEVVDYTGLRQVKGKYNEQELNQKLMIQKRYDMIYKYYKKYKSSRALGFCCSRAHAEAMAKEFCIRGIASVAVYSNANGEFSEDRQKAIEKLKKKEIKVIFSVDMFNEGIDICSVDMVMFLRPTESSTVYLQQLGRGLRKYKRKEFLNVLDFISNYEKAGNAPFLLSGQTYSKEFSSRAEQQDFEFPEDCIVDFDMRLIDLFHEMAKKTWKVKDYIQYEYYRIKDLLDGKVPSRMDLFTYIEDEVYQVCMNHANENPLKRYLAYLHELEELNQEEEEIYSGIGKEFLSTLETTNMSKSYKMPILLAFYNEGNIKMAIDEGDVYQSYKEFYDTGINWKDLAKDKSSRGYKDWTKEHYIKEARKNPVKFLMKSGNGFFVEKSGYVLALNDQLQQVVKLPEFVKHVKDIIDYRTMDYYKRRYESDLN